MTPDPVPIVAESPRGDLWRCTECHEVVPVAELGDVVNGLAPWHVRPEHDRSCPGGGPTCDRLCPVPVQCGPVLLVATFQCSGCEDQVEYPAPLRVPTTMGFHVTRTPTGNRVCGLIERADPVTEGDTHPG